MERRLKEKDVVALSYFPFSLSWLRRSRLTGNGPKFYKINNFSVRYLESDIQDWLRRQAVCQYTNSARSGGDFH
jgi:predicted DNA-binding transcriptional regulator AlpA